MAPIVLGGSVISTGFSIVIDPDDTPLDISDGSSYRPIGQITLPDWPLKSVYAGSFDTWGELPAGRHMPSNGELVIPLRVYGTSAANLLDQIDKVQQKVAKINRCEDHGIGGVVKITYPSGDSYRFLAVQASATHNLTQGFVTRFRELVEFRCMVLPMILGDEVQLATSSGNGVMVFLADALKGDLPGLGRLVVGATSQNQAAVHVGVQSEHYDAAATAALTFNGTDLTPLGTSTDTGTAIRNTDLIPTWQAIASTEIAGVGHMTHVGDFQVWVRTRRPTGNTGAVSLRLSYARGVTFRNPTTNPQVDFDANDREGVDCWVNLGQVHLPRGSTKWRGHLEALSTVAGDEIDLKAVRLLPVTEGYIELSDPPVFETPSSSPTARDEFDQTAGALTGKTAPVGGTWGGAGDADDFTVETSGKTAQRSVGSADADANTGRYAVSGVAASAGQAAQVDFKATQVVAVGFLRFGVLARYTDTSNWLWAGVTFDSTTLLRLAVRKRVAGTVTTLYLSPAYTLTYDAFLTARLAVDAGGRWWFWFGPQERPTFVGAGQDADLATGGALATGKPGFYDAINAATNTRNYDNFLAFVPTTTAAIFAGRELELRHNAAVREEETADEWSTVPVRDGNYLRIPAAGMEGRQARLIVAAYRNDPNRVANDNDDALTATLYGTPVYLSVPEP